ncbi:MAG: response regulator [candidate division Zixibacteria bacterium]|nr:response regulator [candidate division Zixibacteria bacterium]
MGGSASRIRRYYHFQRSNQLSSIIAQADRVSELSAAHLNADFTAVFYRQPGSEELIPVALQRAADIPVSELKLLERAWSKPESSGNMGGLGLVTLAPEFTHDTAQRDHFAEENGFLYRYAFTHSVEGELVAEVVAYWRAQPPPISERVEHSLRLLLEVLVGTMCMADQLHLVNNFSIRLGEALSMFELQGDDCKFSDLVSRIIRQSRLALPLSGVCLLSFDVATGRFKVNEFFDSQPARPQFAGEITRAVEEALGTADPREADGRLWFDLSAGFENDCSTLVGVEICPDRNHRFVLAVWTRQASGFSFDDLELLSVFSLLAQTVMRVALHNRSLRKSKRTLEKSSARMADHEVLAALTDMTSGIAHDFNNILGGIIGRLQLLKLKATEDSLQFDLGKIESLALEGAETVRRIQEYSTRSRYKELEPVDIREVLETGIHYSEPEWKALAELQGIAVECDISVNEAVINGCRADLLIVLEKLIENAVEHSPAAATVKVTLVADDAGFHVSVADNGDGIPPENQARVFYPFFTTKSERGAGLGLAIVHGIVVRHGGRIEFESDSENGSLFKVSFNRPVAVNEDSDITRRTKRPDRLRILVVDDDDQIREILKDMLTIDGHTATTCPDGYSALETIEKQSFDLVITDLGMPGMSGLEMAAVVHEKHPELPIAMITGWGTQLDESEVSMKGIKTVLPKPFHLKDVKALITDLVTD